MSLKDNFQDFWRQVQNTYFVEHPSMVAYDNILGKKQRHFSTYFDPLRKISLRACLFPFEILSNENSFKQFVAISLLPNCKEGY